MRNAGSYAKNQWFQAPCPVQWFRALGLVQWSQAIAIDWVTCRSICEGAMGSMYSQATVSSLTRGRERCSMGTASPKGRWEAIVPGGSIDEEKWNLCGRRPPGWNPWGPMGMAKR